MTTNPQSVDEKILLKQLQRGERKAYDYLWSKYKPPLYYKILQRVRDPLDAEDIITETFSRVYSKINDFKPTYKLSTWIFTIAINLSTDKTKEKIESLNKTIAEWEKITGKLEKVVKGMKAACLATSTFFHLLCPPPL